MNLPPDGSVRRSDRTDVSRPDRIELRGLRALGTHGVLPEERERPQPFEIDLDLMLDLNDAGRSDNLADTVDYGAVAAAASAEVAGPHAELLEHLAERIARAALTTGGPKASAVTVSLRKVRPPVGVDLATAGVRIHRSRDEPAASP